MMVEGLGLARDLAARGFGVVLPEYRGYGVSRGSDPILNAMTRLAAEIGRDDLHTG